MIARFDSLAHFAGHVQKHAQLEPSHGYSVDLGVDGHDALKRTIQGDETIVAGITDGLDGLTFGSGDGGNRWEPSVCGSRVSVPAYLAGNPACMRKRAKRTDARTVRVFASMIGNMAVSGPTMRARGIAILGAIQALLAAQVQVELYLIGDIQGNEPKRGVALPSWDLTDDGSCTFVIPIDTKPLDLSTAGFALTHPAFFRHLVFDLGSTCGFHGGFSPFFLRTLGRTLARHAYAHGGPAPYEECLAEYIAGMRATLGLAPSDVFLPRVIDTDPLLSNPAAWIQARVHQPIHEALTPQGAE